MLSQFNLKLRDLVDHGALRPSACVLCAGVLQRLIFSHSWIDSNVHVHSPLKHLWKCGGRCDYTAVVTAVTELGTAVFARAYIVVRLETQRRNMR